MNDTEMSPTVGAIAAALAKAQGVMRHAAKDSVNPHFKSRYADLAGVIDACREALSSNGIAFSQLARAAGDDVIVRTILLHTSGEWISGVLTVPLSKHDAQGVGSALTYARRYALAAITGVAQDDDDGNDAVRPAPPRAPAKQAPAPAAVDHRARIRKALDTLGITEDQRGYLAGLNRGEVPETPEEMARVASLLEERVAKKSPGG